MGQFISEVELDALAFVERMVLKALLKKTAKKLVSKVLTLGQWEKETATVLRRSHIRMAILASGGKERTGLNAYGIAGRNLKAEYKLLHGFAKEIKDKKLSEAQIVSRAQRYDQSILQTYNEAYHYNKRREGFTKAMRTLDPTADHCPQCPGYVTNGWVDIKKIVPVGTKCDCRGNCRCRVRYKR